MPKILFVTSHWPLAPAYGAQQRVLNIARLIARFAAVNFAIVPTEIEEEETARRSRDEFEIRAVIRPELDKERTISDRLRHEFDPGSTVTDAYSINHSDREVLRSLIKEHDLVWLHTIRTVNWFRQYRWPFSILDVDDLPSRTYQSAAQSGADPVRRLLDRRMAWVWHRRECAFRKRFDVLTVCSDADREYLGPTERIHVLPNGANALPVRTRVSVSPPRIGLIGNCGFMPNRDGIEWFIRDAWPLIKRDAPKTELRLVGRESEGDLTRLGPDIAGLGWLEDPASEIATWSAMIVPIRVGAGTRVKVVDGFARKCPVVATTIGAFGYDVTSEREILIADSARDFASACLRLLQDPNMGVAIAEAAHQRFLENWTWASFEGTVRTAIGDCLARTQSAQDHVAENEQSVSKRLQATRG